MNTDTNAAADEIDPRASERLLRQYRNIQSHMAARGRLIQNAS
jgi:uncharacterized protein YdgA (DUF945 family)